MKQNSNFCGNETKFYLFGFIEIDFFFFKYYFRCSFFPLIDSQGSVCVASAMSQQEISQPGTENSHEVFH